MSSSIKMYGIKNCDTVRKAIRWLSDKQIDCEFHDLKKEIPSAELIDLWLDNVGQDKLINKRGLTWRKISAEEKLLNDQDSVVKLIQKNPTVVKRPVIFNGTHWSVGFNPDDWNNLFL